MGIFLVALLSSSLVSSPVGAAEAPLAEVDRMIAGLEKACAGAEGLPVEAERARARKECVASFDFAGMAASYGKTWTAADLKRDWNDFVFALVMNQVCVGTASGKSDSCADPSPLWDVQDHQKGRPGMGPVAEDRTLRQLCREEQNEPLAMREYPRGPEAFREACRVHVAGKVPADKRAAVCAAAAAHYDDPKLAAAAAVAVWELHDQSQVDNVARDFAVARGLVEPKDCKTPDPFKTDMCFASYSLAQKRVGKAADCGDSAFCRMMTGGGAAACAPYELKARALFCERDFKSLQAREKELERARAAVPELRASIEKAGKLLAAVKTPDAPAVAERRAKLAELNGRLTAIAAGSAAPSPADRR